MSFSGTIRTSVLLKDNANECLARVQGGKCLYQGQCERVSCSRTMRTSVLLGYKEESVFIRDNKDE